MRAESLPDEKGEPDRADRGASALAASLLALVPRSTEPLDPDTAWVPRRKRTFDMVDLYGDR